MKFKTVDPAITSHPVEKRGFVKSEGADIFYRLIPAYDSTPEDSTKPIIVVINGGPGISCSFYRPLDFDYLNLENPKNGSPNRFLYLLKSFRVVVVDQRGTDGQSMPLDLSDPNLDYLAVGRNFSSDIQARDYLAVINHLVPSNEDFYMIAQSYGGMVGMQYLALPNKRKPKGIVFSASALPYEDFVNSSRRKEQLRLNLELEKTIPNIQEKLNALRNHLATESVEQNLIHQLYSFLGKGTNWENSLVQKIDQLLYMKKDKLENELNQAGEVNILNYILSSSNFIPKQTDRGIARKHSIEVPFQKWMIDESVTYLSPMNEEWKEKLVQRIDADPPDGTPMPSLELLRQVIAENQVLFTAAENDAFVPADQFKKTIEKFLVPGHTQIKTIPGGHNAIFLEKGYEELLQWIKTL